VAYLIVGNPFDVAEFNRRTKSSASGFLAAMVLAHYLRSLLPNDDIPSHKAIARIRAERGSAPSRYRPAH
jgi:hypothetical protein